MTAPLTVAAAHTKDPARLHVGTLRYTMAGLLWVFVWLLWGDFCFTVMEYVNGQIVPLRLRELQAPDWVLPIILTTVPSIISFTLNPVISTISDRHPVCDAHAQLPGRGVGRSLSPDTDHVMHDGLPAAGCSAQLRLDVRKLPLRPAFPYQRRRQASSGQRRDPPRWRQRPRQADRPNAAGLLSLGAS